MILVLDSSSLTVMLSFGINTSFSISTSVALASGANRFADVNDLIFFFSCDDGLEGEDGCRFDLLVCVGRSDAMFGGLEVITGTDNGADVRANVCS